MTTSRFNNNNLDEYTYVYIGACYSPLLSSLRGLWKNKNDNTYYISDNLPKKIEPDTSQQYMLFYTLEQPKYFNYTNKLYNPKQLSLQELQGVIDSKDKYVKYGNSNWYYFHGEWAYL
jgi:hypothetical protein